jgi:alpha-beta hydrolase superfamily lysophospholipase
VLLLPGADSTKEELYHLGDHVVARGLACAAFDGPGQGSVSLQGKLGPDYELAVQAIIDALAGRADLDAGRLAVGGISYGGLFAIRTAAIDERVRAVVSIASAGCGQPPPPRSTTPASSTRPAWRPTWTGSPASWASTGCSAPG